MVKCECGNEAIILIKYKGELIVAECMDCYDMKHKYEDYYGL